MDPRQALSRSQPTALQSPYGNPNMSAYAGNMPPTYGVTASTHLPPINASYPAPPHIPPSGQSYLSQPQYRDNLGRPYQNPSPAGTPDRYGQQMSGQQGMPNLQPNSMLPQPQGQVPQPQPYTTQPGTRPNSYPQPLAPAPPRSNMDPYGQYAQPGPDNRQWAGADQMQGMTSHMAQAPIHVVGSQGRRGILPSAPGRPPVMPNGMNSPKNNAIPQKDADGKFPCPNCNKTYLHAKHLKRHMLRHTGDRPYMCVLCTDTFSRSDILKRHFQKCSIRRGNPTGASHLSNPAAHLKKSSAAAQKAAAAAASAAQANSGTNTPAAGSQVQPSPYTTTSMTGPSMPAPSTSLPAMNSLAYNANGQTEIKPPVGSLQNSQPTNGADQGSSSWNMPSVRNSGIMYDSNNNSPAPGTYQSHDNWDHMMPPHGANDNYGISQIYNYGPEHGSVKHEAHDNNSANYYANLGADAIAPRTAK